MKVHRTLVEYTNKKTRIQRSYKNAEAEDRLRRQDMNSSHNCCQVRA